MSLQAASAAATTRARLPFPERTTRYSTPFRTARSSIGPDWLCPRNRMSTAPAAGVGRGPRQAGTRPFPAFRAVVARSPGIREVVRNKTLSGLVCARQRSR